MRLLRIYQCSAKNKWFDVQNKYLIYDVVESLSI